MASGRSAGVPHLRSSPATPATANKPVTPRREKEPAVATGFGVTCYTASLSL